VSVHARTTAHAAHSKSIPNYVANGDRHDLGFVNFDITADLSPIFNWNVKQLFVYLTAEYQTENNVRARRTFRSHIHCRHSTKSYCGTRSCTGRTCK
jgi:hypothetical protein